MQTSKYSINYKNDSIEVTKNNILYIINIFNLHTLRHETKFFRVIETIILQSTYSSMSPKLLVKRLKNAF